MADSGGKHVNSKITDFDSEEYLDLAKSVLFLWFFGFGYLLLILILDIILINANVNLTNPIIIGMTPFAIFLCIFFLHLGKELMKKHGLKRIIFTEKIMNSILFWFIVLILMILFASILFLT